MRDYANRHYQFEAPRAQANVPIKWRYVVAAAVLMLVLYPFSRHHAPSSPTVKIAKPVQAKVVTPKQKVKFDFYQMLTQNSNAGEVAGNPAQAAAKAPVAYHYYVQAGSYENHADAAQQKVNLILSGVSDKLIKVFKGQHGHYRVALGPYQNVTLADQEQKLLKEKHISAQIVKHSDLKA